MNTASYYPQNLINLLPWLGTQREQLRSNFAAIGLTQDQADEKIAVIDQHIAEIEAVLDQQETLAVAVQRRDDNLDTFGKSYREDVQRWKRTVGFTPDLAVAFKWDTPTVTPPNSDTAKPRISGTHTEPGLLVVDWVRGPFDGVEVEGSYDNQNWSRLDFDTRSPFDDRRANQVPGQPETRYFRLRYRYKGQAFGQYSDVKSVLV